MTGHRFKTRDFFKFYKHHLVPMETSVSGLTKTINKQEIISSNGKNQGLKWDFG